MTIIKTALRLFIAGLFLPLVFSGMMYIGSTTAYTWGVFNEAGFHTQYDEGIYKYRVLGKESLLYFQQLLADNKLPRFMPGVFKADLNVESTWYAAYFYSNSLYLCLACCVLFFIFHGHKNDSYQHVELPMLGLTLLMTLTQYVVVPYDTLSYLFLLIGIYLSLFKKQSLLTQGLLAGCVVLATLNRETAFLIISFYVAQHHQKILLHNPLKGISTQQWVTVALSLAFLMTYFALRLYYGFDKALYQDVQFFESLHITAVVGLLFLALLLLNLLLTSPVTPQMKAYLLTSAPYSVMILLFAMPNEMRLWIPIILPLIILKLQPEQAGIKGEA
ncbi:MAG: hypothetical protein HRU20_09455 [Pseudomonadales bacterium]|nr:hypothetical protein [Pseudomonadales bacterium]